MAELHHPTTNSTKPLKIRKVGPEDLQVQHLLYTTKPVRTFAESRITGVIAMSTSRVLRVEPY